MIPAVTSMLLVLQVIIFVAAIMSDVAQRNEQLVWNYSAQSFAVALLLAILGINEHSNTLLVVAVMTILVKCLVTPRILLRLIKKHDLVFAAPAFLNMPLYLGAMLLLVISVRETFSPLLIHIISVDRGGELFYLSISAFFASLFLAVNRRGAFSQITGILSAENALVVCAALLNVQTELWLELGILADIFAWMLIGSTFVSIVSKHFKTTDITTMRELAE